MKKTYFLQQVLEVQVVEMVWCLEVKWCGAVIIATSGALSLQQLGEGSINGVYVTKDTCATCSASSQANGVQTCHSVTYNYTIK